VGGLSRGAAQTDKENSSGRDTYPFDDAEGSGASPCVDSKLELGERRAPAAGTAGMWVLLLFAVCSAQLRRVFLSHS